MVFRPCSCKMKHKNNYFTKKAEQNSTQYFKFIIVRICYALFYKTDGFTGEFIAKEKYLCVRGADGQIECDALGKSILECMCGDSRPRGAALILLIFLRSSFTNLMREPLSVV
jgi:hypothetical protein